MTSLRDDPFVNTFSLTEANVVVLFLDHGVGAVVEVVRLERARQGGEVLCTIRRSAKHESNNSGLISNRI